MKIDIDGIGQRILSLPIPPRTTQHAAGKTGILFLSEGPVITRGRLTERP